MLQNKYYLFIPMVYLAACMNTSKEDIKPGYDEASLRAYVLGTPATSESKALASLDSILVAASNDSVVFRKTVSFLTEPFSSPNSSYRNQHLYAKLLEAEMQSNWFLAEEKGIAKGKLTLLQQNNLGNVANDFPYTTPGGAVLQMHAINANFLLLYFNNPECEACKEMKASLAGSAIITQKIKSGELKVLSVYMGTDKANWRSHLGEYPKPWLQGIGEDATLYKAKKYDLSAIPTMYLLDKDKRVLMRDYFTTQSIEQLLQ